MIIRIIRIQTKTYTSISLYMRTFIFIFTLFYINYTINSYSGIATGYGLDGREVGVRVPVGSRTKKKEICIVVGGIKVHSTLRPLNGLLCQPRVIMIVEKSVE
jgi:hypothetical protein